MFTKAFRSFMALFEEPKARDIVDLCYHQYKVDAVSSEVIPSSRGLDKQTVRSRSGNADLLINQLISIAEALESDSHIKLLKTNYPEWESVTLTKYYTSTTGDIIDPVMVDAQIRELLKRIFLVLDEMRDETNYGYALRKSSSIIEEGLNVRRLFCEGI